MLSLFPPPGPPLPPSSPLLVKGPCHKSALFHLALGHVLDSPENEVLIISSSQSRLKEKLASGLDEWLISSGTTSVVRAAMSRIVILYPPSAAHFALLTATLDGTQSNPKLIGLWAELAVMPTEQLSMIILDDVSNYFESSDQVEVSLITLLNRLLQSTNRVSASSDRAMYILLYLRVLQTLIRMGETLFQRSMHLENAVMGFFECICTFENAESSSMDIPSSQDNEAPQPLCDEQRYRKTFRVTSNRAGHEGQPHIEYTEIVKSRPNSHPVVQFAWE